MSYGIQVWGADGSLKLRIDDFLTTVLSTEVRTFPSGTSGDQVFTYNNLIPVSRLMALIVVNYSGNVPYYNFGSGPTAGSSRLGDSQALVPVTGLSVLATGRPSYMYGDDTIRRVAVTFLSV